MARPASGGLPLLQQTNLVEEELLCDFAVPIIEPGADTGVQELLPLAGIFADECQLWQVEEVCGSDGLPQLLTLLGEVHRTGVEERQAAREGFLGNQGRVERNNRYFLATVVLPVCVRLGLV